MFYQVENNLQNDLLLRIMKLQNRMAHNNMGGLLLSSNVNLFYLSGKIFMGYIWLPVEGEPWFFVRRPVNLEGSNVCSIRKPEDIIPLLAEHNVRVEGPVMLEGDMLTYNEWNRLAALFGSAEVQNGSTLLREARSIKTPYEISMLMESARRQSDVYRTIPSIFRPGMTDNQLSIELERAMRLAGNLGLFRVSGPSMEVFMGSLLTGDNASAPSAYDFALGGEGIHPSIPIGQNGSPLNPGQSVMIDLNGNFTGYIADLTRTFSVGSLPKEALDAHKVAMEIEDQLARLGKPGVTGEELYEAALRLAAAHNLSDKFMGLTQQAKFVGHGVGLEINELPVLGVRSRIPLEPGMAIAIEPKFVFPGIGAVGLEDTYIVGGKGMECIHDCPREIIDLVL